MRRASLAPPSASWSVFTRASRPSSRIRSRCTTAALLTARRCSCDNVSSLGNVDDKRVESRADTMPPAGLIEASITRVPSTDNTW
ncbi:MAG: hypothetical protein ACK55Z_15205, partial [bacterium]